MLYILTVHFQFPYIEHLKLKTICWHLFHAQLLPLLQVESSTLDHIEWKVVFHDVVLEN